MGLKTMQSGKERRKIAKINPKSKEKDFFLVAVVFEIFLQQGNLSSYLYNWPDGLAFKDVLLS